MQSRKSSRIDVSAQQWPASVVVRGRREKGRKRTGRGNEEKSGTDSEAKGEEWKIALRQSYKSLLRRKTFARTEQLLNTALHDDKLCVLITLPLPEYSTVASMVCQFHRCQVFRAPITYVRPMVTRSRGHEAATNYPFAQLSPTNIVPSATNLLTLVLAFAIMSHSYLTADSTSNFQLIFNNALKAYEAHTRKDLLAHPLAAQLQACNSPADILSILQQQVQGLDQSRACNDRWTKCLDPTVSVLYSLSETLGEGVALVSLRT